MGKTDEKPQEPCRGKKKKLAFFLGLAIGLFVGALIMFIGNTVVVSHLP